MQVARDTQPKEHQTEGFLEEVTFKQRTEELKIDLEREGEGLDILRPDGLKT